MFVDEKTNIKIYADLNKTVSRATLRAEDLVPAFIEVIKDTPEWQQIAFHPNLHWDLKVIFDPTSDGDERWESEEMSYFLNETLIDVLNSYAPEGYYFGSHEGDGSDFGFWELADGQE